MSQSIKLKNNTYLDSSSITDDRKKLSDMLNGTAPMGNVVVDSIENKNLLNKNMLLNKSDYTESISVSGSSYQAIKYQLKPNTTYTLSTHINSWTATGSWTYVLFDSNKTLTTTLQSGDITSDITYTITTGSNGLLYFGTLYGFNSSSRIPAWLDTIDIQLEKGSNATSYTEYQGLLDESSIGNKKIIAGTIQSKNLFNIKGNVNIRGNKYYSDTYANTVSGDVLTCNVNSINEHSVGQIIEGLYGKTVTFSAKILSTGTGSKCWINIYEGGSIKQEVLGNAGDTIKITRTIDDNYPVFTFATSGGTGGQFTNIQVEIGNEVTEYMPYQKLSTSLMHNMSIIRSEEGWYRVARIINRREDIGTGLILYITNSYGTVAPCYIMASIMTSYRAGKIAILNANRGGTVAISKIRLQGDYTNNIYYVDIYYNVNSGNSIDVQNVSAIDDEYVSILQPTLVDVSYNTVSEVTISY